MKINKILLVSISYFSLAMLGVYITLFQYTILNVFYLFDINTAMMGLLIAMQHVGMLLPPLFLGVLSGKIGKKKVMMISYVLMILGTFLAGSTQSFIAFIISISIIGAGFSVTEATLSAILTDEFPDQSARHLNFSQVTFSVGALTGPFIAQELINSGIFFKDLYIYISIIFLVLGTIFIFIKHENDKGADEEKNSSFRIIEYLGNRTFLLLAIAIFLFVGIENTIANFADSYYELFLNVPHLSAVALALFWGAMIPSRLLAGIIKTNAKRYFCCCPHWYLLT